MKTGFIIIAIFFSFLCSSQNTSPDGFLKAKQYPLWTFSPHFTKDSILYSKLILQPCDSLIVLYEEPLAPVGDWMFYILSAKTGKEIRKVVTDADYIINQNGNMFSTQDSLLSNCDAYTGNPKWQFNINKFFSTDNVNKGITFYLAYTKFYDSILYVMAIPEYAQRKPRYHHAAKEHEKIFPDRNEKNSKKHEYLFLVNANTGKVIAHHLYNKVVNFAYGDTAIIDSDTLHAIDMKSGKKIWNLDNRFINSTVPKYHYEFNLLSLIYSGKSTLTYSRDDEYQPFDRFDSTFAAVIDKKTGKELCNKFIGRQFYGNNLLTPDSTTFYFLDDSLSAYNACNIERKWSITANTLQPYGMKLSDKDRVDIKSNSKHLVIVDTNSRVMSINKNNGSINWSKKFGYRIYSPQEDFSLLPDYIILTLETIHGVYASDEHTVVMDLNNPDNIASEGSVFKVIYQDDPNKIVYLFDDKTFSLLKVKMP
jgi:outer membrane protein assembly factor BamB